MGLFSKKNCSVCGGDIGLFGNRKLEDGNLCKSCAAKLSPWFSERRNSTVAQIRAQLNYREENKSKVAAFHTTSSFGEDTKLLVDEDDSKFVVTDAANLIADNPDVLDFTQVTGVDLDVDEDVSEAETKDKDGNSVSYNPPRYDYSYDFHILIRVNHPYFDEIRFRLNSSDVQTTTVPVPAIRKPNPKANVEYAKYYKMGQDIVRVLEEGRQQIRDEKAAAAAPKVAKICPGCGASTIPDLSGRCEYCGSPVG